MIVCVETSRAENKPYHLRNVLVLYSVYFSSGILCNSLHENQPQTRLLASHKTGTRMQSKQAHCLMSCIHGKLKTRSSCTKS